VGEEEEEEEVYRGMVKMFCNVSNNLAAALMKLERWKDAKVRLDWWRERREGPLLDVEAEEE